MIKTVFREYEVTQTFTRNEVKQLIAKKHPSEWGQILFNKIVSDEQVRHEAKHTFQYPMSMGVTHWGFKHSFSLDKTPTGTVLVNTTLTYIQAVEIATDKADWVAYRNVFFDANLKDFEKDLLQKI